jgi:hypothetical protein
MRSAHFQQNHNSGLHVMTKMTYISIQNAFSTAGKFFQQAVINDPCQRGLFNGITIMANFMALLESLQ